MTEGFNIAKAMPVSELIQSCPVETIPYAEPLQDSHFDVKRVLKLSKRHKVKSVDWTLWAFPNLVLCVSFVLLLYYASTRSVGQLSAFACIFGLGYFVSSASAYEIPEFDSANWVTYEKAKELFRAAENTAPVLNQHMKCYHKERRGSSYEDVTTHSVDIPKQFADFIDYSPRLEFKEPIKQGEVYKIYVEKTWLPGNIETTRDFEAQKNKIIENNKDRDREYSFRETYSDSLPDFIIVTSQKPWYYSICLFWCCVSLGLGCIWAYLLDSLYAVKRVYPSFKVLSTVKFSEMKKREVEQEKLENMF